MNATDFVAIWIQEVAQMHDTHGAFTRTGRLFNAGAAVGYGNVMKLFNLLGRVADKTNR